MIVDPYLLPVTSRPNQTFKAKIIIDKQNVELTIQLNYREVCGYWTMSITDKDGQMLLANVPLLKGEGETANILYQFDYLGLGYLAVVDAAGSGADYPNALQLGTDFVLVWGSNDE